MYDARCLHLWGGRIFDRILTSFHHWHIIFEVKFFNYCVLRVASKDHCVGVISQADKEARFQQSSNLGCGIACGGDSSSNFYNALSLCTNSVDFC